MRKTLFWLLAAILSIAVFSGPASALTLPIEVMMGNQPLRSVTINLPTGTAAQASVLQLRFSGLEYAGEVGVQIGNSAQVVLSNSMCSVSGPGAAWGGIGGAVPTLTCSLAIPAGAVVDGSNRITLQYLQTDGVNSGYRVIGVAVLDSGGHNLLPARQIVWDDPAKWSAPLIAGKVATAQDVQAGWLLYTTASLIHSPQDKTALNITCSHCHTDDGRDLSYFNYSNISIVSRSMFHGLTRTQGQQIASYIRSLPYRSVYGRPWNPPYQPGPGLDSRPVSEWAAGAGVDAVLTSDAAMLPSLFPQGITTAAIAPQSTLNVRELPIAVPLPTWNQWLPRVHPNEFWGDAFTSSPYFADYQALVAHLASAQAGGTLTSYLSGPGSHLGHDLYTFIAEGQRDFDMANVATITNWTPEIAEGVYSTGRWRMVKEWGLMQQYGLEGQTALISGEGPTVEPRSWYSHSAFSASPKAVGIPALPGSFLGNSPVIHAYHVDIWYQLQLILNPGNGHNSGNWPIDWAYVYGVIENSARQSNSGAALRLLAYMVKGSQETASQGLPTGTTGWAPRRTVAMQELSWHELDMPLWTGIDASMRAQILTAMLTNWFSTTKLYSPAQYAAAGVTDPSDVYNPQANILANARLVDAVHYFIPRFAVAGVDSTLLNAVDDWAALMWPAQQNNWPALKLSVTPLLNATN